VEAWSSAAESYGFVRKRNGKLELASGMADLLLDRSHPEYLGGQMSYLALRSLEYGKLGDLFSLGRTSQMTSSLKAIEEATHWDHFGLLREVKRNKSLHIRLGKGRRFLDVGCGTGSLIAKLRREYPGTGFAGIDPSKQAIKHARKMLGRAVRLETAKAEDMVFSGEFDIAYLGESLYAARDRKKVLDNCFLALKSGGILAVIEGLLPTSKIQAIENKLIMGMQLDFALQGDRFLTHGELLALLRESGFRNIVSRALGGAAYLVTARKR
jgi:SAM-dependent methyltransferase